MKLALIEASEGKLAKSLGDRFLQFCYMYDPKLGAYSLQAMRVMQAGGVLSAGLVFGTIGVLWSAERRKRRRITAAKMNRGQSTPAAARSSAGMVAS
jgi:hypothetical protein